MPGFCFKWCCDEPSYPCICPDMPTNLHVADSVLFPSGIVATYNAGESSPSITVWLASGTYDFPGSEHCPAVTVPVEYRLFCTSSGMGFKVYSYFKLVGFDDPLGPFNCPDPTGTRRDVATNVGGGTFSCSPFILSQGVSDGGGGYIFILYGLSGPFPTITWTP